MEWPKWPNQTHGKFPLFVSPISPIPFHSIPIFHFFQLFKSFKLFYSIPFFFNFPNPYTISLNLNHSYYLKISKVKPFLHHFYKSFSNYSKLFSNYFFPSHLLGWNGQNDQTKQRVNNLCFIFNQMGHLSICKARNLILVPRRRFFSHETHVY